MSSGAPFSYRYRLGDDELRRAWIREYYRRPGWRGLRIFGGPAFVALGVMMGSGTDPFMRGMGIVTVLFGVYYVLKPWLGARAMLRARRAAGLHEREFAVRIDRKGIEIDDGRVRTRFAWSEVECAGRTTEYVWYQVRGGHRATIPLRVIDDRDALTAFLQRNTRWAG